MKKTVFILLCIFFLPLHVYSFTGYPKIALVVHAPPYTRYSLINQDVTRKANELSAAGIRVEVIFRDIPARRISVTDLLNDMKRSIKGKNQILISAFFGFSREDNRRILKFCERYPDNLFIIPWLDEDFESSYSAVNPNNVLLMPDPITDILSYLKQLMERYGSELKLLGDELKKRATVVLCKYVGWQNEISASAVEAINSWEKSTRGVVTPAAFSLLTKTYSSETIRYVKAFPDGRADIRILKETALEEMRQILNVYSMKTSKKKVTAELVRASGVNGCESLPCKKRCCDKYRQWNHECFHKIDCD